MSYTVAELLADVGAHVDKTTTLPTSTELLVRVQYCNIAQNEWYSAYTWGEFQKEWSPTVLLSMASVALPSDFNKFIGVPYNAAQSTDNDYWQISPSEKRYKLSTDRYCVIRKNSSGSKYLEINPALASGVSLVAPYYAFPSSLVTTNSTVLAPREYMARKVSGYVLEARSDPRFQIFMADANNIIRGLIEDEDTPSGAEENQIPDWATTTSFRIGEE